jgi:hypothetical protein
VTGGPAAFARSLSRVYNHYQDPGTFPYPIHPPPRLDRWTWKASEPP